MHIYDHHSCFRFVSSNKLVRANSNGIEVEVALVIIPITAMCDNKPNKIVAARSNSE